jgi:hypothetical protein
MVAKILGAFVPSRSVTSVAAIHGWEASRPERPDSTPSESLVVDAH